MSRTPREERAREMAAVARAGRADGIQIRHVTGRRQNQDPFLVPIDSISTVGIGADGLELVRACPLCHVPHLVKTVHLWLDDSGACLVSPGVLVDLKSSTLWHLFEVSGHEVAPPAIRIGDRDGTDFVNRRIAPLTPLVPMRKHV